MLFDIYMRLCLCMYAHKYAHETYVLCTYVRIKHTRIVLQAETVCNLILNYYFSDMQI